MLPKILIIIGVLLIVGGIFGLLTVCVQPLMKAFRIVYTQDWEDFWYEHGKGQDAQQAGRRVLLIMYSILIVLGLCLVLSGLAIQYMPQGNDSLLSTESNGATTGDNSQWADGENASTVGGSESPAEYSIVISGEVIRVNGKTFETIEDFENELKNMDRTKQVFLVDDFAVSATYHQVKDLVNRYGLVFGESSE